MSFIAPCSARFPNCKTVTFQFSKLRRSATNTAPSSPTRSPSGASGCPLVTSQKLYSRPRHLTLGILNLRAQLGENHRHRGWIYYVYEKNGNFGDSAVGDYCRPRVF